jgi:hypothetical protein
MAAFLNTPNLQELPIPGLSFSKVDFDSALPVVYLDSKYRLQKVSDGENSFFQSDLDVSRLNSIHGWLNLCGRLMAVARPLHRQLMMNRKIIVTEQADLHLTWDDFGIFIKPLPLYLLSKRVWTDYLCKDQELYEAALGFLLSYTWLITTRNDHSIATDKTGSGPLLPEDITWKEWRELVLVMTEGSKFGKRDHVNKRYRYGELRLDRLNYVWRLSPSTFFSPNHSFVRGYYFGYHRYGVFFQKNFAWLIVVFAYVTIVLTGMQVGLALDRLQSNTAFSNACYGFAIFSIVVPVVFVGVAIAFFAFLFLDNIFSTVINWAKHSKQTHRKEKHQTFESSHSV